LIGASIRLVSPVVLNSVAEIEGRNTLAKAMSQVRTRGKTALFLRNSGMGATMGPMFRNVALVTRDKACTAAA
jgi:hypothetical protein